MQYKLKHRLSAALMAGAMCCTMIPAASAEEISTPEIADTFVPEITDSVTPDLSQITENLYNDLPDAPTGSYLGSMGLPVATGETKISISSWGSDLYDGEDAHMDADALNADESNITVGKTPDANYAVVPLLVQTEYPADGAASEIILPDGVELLSYASTDYDLISANKAELAQILHQTYAEQSAAATGFYVKASRFHRAVCLHSPRWRTVAEIHPCAVVGRFCPDAALRRQRHCNSCGRADPAVCHRQDYQHRQRGRYLAYLVQRTRSLLLQSWSERSAQWLPDLHF